MVENPNPVIHRAFPLGENPAYTIITSAYREQIHYKILIEQVHSRGLSIGESPLSLQRMNEAKTQGLWLHASIRYHSELYPWIVEETNSS